jgi:hypothetical protein
MSIWMHIKLLGSESMLRTYKEVLILDSGGKRDYFFTNTDLRVKIP